ncbi:MAG: DMT family transporter [Acidimicrobiia bacterium]
MDRANRRPRGGFVFVAGGAALWGTDALFRRGLALDLPAPTLVFLEHLVLALVTGPVLWRHRRSFRGLDRGDWIALVLVGVGASAVATSLFTAAFRYGDPTTPLLLQKVQPLVVVIAARALIGERLLPRFTWFFGGGLIGAYLVAFPDPSSASASRLTPVLLALGAAVLWGLGTVLGRRLTDRLTFGALTAARFAIGLPAAALLVWLVPGSSMPALSGSDILAVFLLAMIPGLLALLLYYYGLKGTPASAATLAELAFPLTAVGLNYVVFGTTLTASQVLGAVLLAGTITAMSLLSRVGEEAIGVSTKPFPLGENA